MTVISKTAGGLSLISCIHDAHKTALIHAKNEYAKVSSNSVISSSVGGQKINRLSYKDSQRKEYLSRSQIFLSTKELFAKVAGYVKGMASALVQYIPNFILQTVAFASRNRTIANIATAGLAIVETFDFLKNSTNLSQKTDYLE